MVQDVLQPIEWSLESETKKIGNYSCFKATASIPSDELTWYSFSWDKLRNTTESDSTQVKEVKMTQIEAWYAPQIPVRHGPLDYWGLPGLILEVSANNTTMLCSKIVLNPDEIIEIEAPAKGKEVSKNEYQNIAINIIIVLSIFAFTLNLIREIVKDIEDMKGDNFLNIKTLPIIFGIHKIKVFSSFLCIIPIALIMLLIINYSHIYKITMLYLLFFSLIPLLYFLLKIRIAKKKKDFHKLSNLLKIIMFLGISSLIIFSIFH